jgi:RNA polymerase sigma factor (sigma-70 family)
MQESRPKPNRKDATGEDPMESLSARFRPALVEFFRRRVAGAAEAEDLAQEVFLRLLRRGNVAAIEEVRAYLFETASSVLIDRGRRDKARHMSAHRSFQVDEHGPQDFASDRVCLGRERLDRVSAALLELPQRARTVFILRRLEGFKYSDIARQLGISVSAVEKQMMRAISFLAERVGDP